MIGSVANVVHGMSEAVSRPVSAGTRSVVAVLEHTHGASAAALAEASVGAAANAGILAYELGAMHTSVGHPPGIAVQAAMTAGMGLVGGAIETPPARESDSTSDDEDSDQQ